MKSSSQFNASSADHLGESPEAQSLAVAKYLSYAWRKAMLANATMRYNDKRIDYDFLARSYAHWYLRTVGPDVESCVRSLQVWRDTYSIFLSNAKLQRATDDAMWALTHASEMHKEEIQDAAIAEITLGALLIPAEALVSR